MSGRCIRAVNRQCKGQELVKKDQGRTIRSALISLSSVVRTVAQALSDRTTGGGKTKEGRYGEREGGVGHGLSDSSGVEDAGDRYGVLVLSLVGVPHAYGVAGGVLRELRSIRVLSKVRTFTSRSRSITGESTP